jgi:NAD(P)-dependent dehydrogenase (short-subunit alcohol dehydrogenase family)
MFSLEGKTAVVTGSSAGLGQRLARTLVLAGARVAGIARRDTELDAEAMSTGRVLSVTADLTEPAQARDAARACLELLDGRVDILVNNAAWAAAGARAQDETYEQIRYTFALNVEAPILLAQAFFPGMRDAGGGCIINISSISGLVGIGRFPQAAYAATKGALDALTREWAAQWARHGIRVNAVAPGVFETEFTATWIQEPAVRDWIIGNTLIPRHGQPEDLDGVLLLLASDAGRYITGQCLIVDGGWTAH